MVTQLTGSSDGVSDIGWMPSTDTSHTSPTSMGLLLQVLDTISLHDSCGSLTTSDTDDIDLLVLIEDLVDVNLLLQQVPGVVDLLLDVTSIDLDLEDVVLLLSEVEFVHLGVDDNPDDGGVLLDSVQLEFGVLGVLGDLFGVLGEGLLLGVHPVLVESSECVLGEL